MSRRARLLTAGLVAAAAAAGAAAWWLARRPDPGDPRLAGFVHARPPVPVVFTSRTEPAGLAAAAPDGEGFAYPGTRPWAAREGRLRVLTPRGTVHELTWGKPLPDGGTLVDVMSPSVAIDGTTVYFAGRKGGDDPGRFRLYEVKLDGTGLKPLTGGPDDAGAVAAPPLRFRPDGSVIPDAERRKIDYDDVDPVELRADPRELLFASSRTPDLGRDHARRSTTLWLLRADGTKTPVTANRNNDRWPWVMTSGYAAFSLWSRNREVVTADGTDLRPFDPARPGATNPTDAWLGAFVRVSSSGHFGMLVKPAVPVWRPRALFNGKIAFMTTFAPVPPAGLPPLAAVQADPGLIAAAPSSAVGPLPRQAGVRLRRAPDRDAAGQPLWTATPSPCPPGDVLLAAAALEAGEATPAAGRFGLYLAAGDWPDQDAPADAAAVDLRLLFDDPELADAEPVAAYRRAVTPPPAGGPTPAVPEASVALAGGRTYRGTVGAVMINGLSLSAMNDLPGQTTDAGEGPVFAAPPAGAVDRIKVFAARRDRFDDPARPRVPGAWEPLLELTAADTAGGPVPTDAPTVLAAFGKDGAVVRWTTAAKDAAGRRATFYAVAGDHYSLTAAGGRHFCVGCHPGHSGIPRAQHRHAERAAD